MDINIEGLLFMLIWISFMKVVASEIPQRTRNSPLDRRYTNVGTDTNKYHPVDISHQEANSLDASPSKEGPAFVPYHEGNLRLTQVKRNTSLDPLSDNYQWHQPMFDHSIWSFTLNVFIRDTFPSSVEFPSSYTYRKYATVLKKMLVRIYKRYQGYKNLAIVGFSTATSSCSFTLEGNYNFVKQVFHKSVYNFIGLSFKVEGYNHLYVVDSLSTAVGIQAEMKAATQKDKICSAVRNICPFDTLCSWGNSSGIICVHKCNANNPCSDNGECYVNTEGTVKCRCREDSGFVYKGDTCSEKVYSFFNKKNTTILSTCLSIFIVVLIIVTCCYCSKGRQTQTSKPTNTTPSVRTEVQGNYPKMASVDRELVRTATPGQSAVHRPPNPERQYTAFTVRQLYLAMAKPTRSPGGGVQNNGYMY